jgi:TonB family protein
MVCDEMAAAVAGRNRYRQSLLRLAARMAHGREALNPQTIGVLDGNTLERRLMKLTEKPTELRGVRRLAAAMVCVAMGVASCGSAIALSLHVDTGSSHAGPSQGSGPVAVSPEIMQTRKISGPAPIYPAEAKKAGIQGSVVIHIVIGKDGTVKTATVASGPTQLRQSALDAVRHWTYSPFLLNGQPVEVKSDVTVTYSLGK